MCSRREGLEQDGLGLWTPAYAFCMTSNGGFLGTPTPDDVSVLSSICSGILHVGLWFHVLAVCEQCICALIIPPVAHGSWWGFLGRGATSMRLGTRECPNDTNLSWLQHLKLGYEMKPGSVYSLAAFYIPGF